MAELRRSVEKALGMPPLGPESVGTGRNAVSETWGFCLGGEFFPFPEKRFRKTEGKLTVRFRVECFHV